MEKIKIKLEEGVEMPKFETEGAVGFDLAINKILKAYKGDVEVTGEKLEKMKQSFLERGYIKMRAFERILFGTGVFAQLPDNIELQIRSRSGVTLKKGIVVFNSPGTVDPDYLGELGIIAFNGTPFLNTVRMGDRLGQAVPKEIVRPEMEQVSEFDKVTKRGEQGYGSTGTN